VAGLTAACGRWLCHWAQREEKGQNRCSEGRGEEGQCRTHPASHTEVAFFSDYTARRCAVNVGSRDSAQEQEAQKAKKGDRTSPQGTMQRSLHRIGRKPKGTCTSCQVFFSVTPVVLTLTRLQMQKGLRGACSR